MHDNVHKDIFLFQHLTMKKCYGINGKVHCGKMQKICIDLSKDMRTSF